MVSTALTIAGSDPSGGAGIQADIKTMSARGVYAMSAITALTVQNTCGVAGVHLVPAAFVYDQIVHVFKDVRVGAVKIGMIANAEIATAVSQALEECAKTTPIVLDPVMVAKGGASLLEPSAVNALRERLIPLATVMTPNLEEAAALLNESVAQSRSEMYQQGVALMALGSQSVLLKGGHLRTPESPDLLLSDSEEKWFECKRVITKNTHGTGCTLSAALASEMAKGVSLIDAVQAAKEYVSGAISSADSLHIGNGHGPTHHFYAQWAD